MSVSVPSSATRTSRWNSPPTAAPTAVRPTPGARGARPRRAVPARRTTAATRRPSSSPGARPWRSGTALLGELHCRRAWHRRARANPGPRRTRQRRSPAAPRRGSAVPHGAIGSRRTEVMSSTGTAAVSRTSGSPEFTMTPVTSDRVAPAASRQSAGAPGAKRYRTTTRSPTNTSSSSPERVLDLTGHPGEPRFAPAVALDGLFAARALRPSEQDVDVEESVEVAGLVLQHAREEAVALDVHRSPLRSTPVTRAHRAPSRGTVHRARRGSPSSLSSGSGIVSGMAEVSSTGLMTRRDGAWPHGTPCRGSRRRTSACRRPPGWLPTRRRWRRPLFRTCRQGGPRQRHSDDRRRRASTGAVGSCSTGSLTMQIGENRHGNRLRSPDWDDRNHGASRCGCAIAAWLDD